MLTMFSCNPTPSVKSRRPPPSTATTAHSSTVSVQPGSGHFGLGHPPKQAKTTDGGTGRQLRPRPRQNMEVLSAQSWEKGRLVMEEEEEEGPKSNGETDEDDGEEAPPVVRRKVSFADAFGLNLVSVKEFDNVEGEESVAGKSPQGESTPSCEEYSFSCLFTLPSSAEELNQRVDTQKIELEAIELLPGTTTIRGTIRVANLCYTKAVYVRMSLDLWASYSDLVAEYVPGSSDRETDRFTFKHTVVPPSDRDGARVEICLRYETPVGTFWANNNNMNYVLFCYKKAKTSERASKVLKEDGTYASKRSCLRPGRRASLEEKTREKNYTTAFAEAEAANKEEDANRKTISKGEMRSLVSHKENKPLVDSLKGRRRHTRLAHAQDYFSQRNQWSPSSHDSASSQEFCQPLPKVQRDPYKCINKQQKTQSRESPKVLTYHEIPLLTLDWNSDKAHQRGASGKGDLWPRTKTASPTAHMVDVSPGMDAWETFLNGTDGTSSQESTVCEKWQTFLGESGCAKLSAVPESEWLQRAASVSPSDDKKSLSKSTTDCQGHKCQLVVDASATPHMQTTQSVSNPCEGQSGKNPSNGSNQYPTKAQRQENSTSEDLPQRSVMNHPAGITEKLNETGETDVTEDLIPSSTECQKHSKRVRNEEEIREGVEGRDDEPIALPTADSVTSSGEPGTTELTLLPETQNGSAVDRISQGESADEGLSFSGEGQVAGTAHNETDDMLAFTETIGRGTEAEGLFVFSISTHALEKGKVDSGTKSTREEIFMPREKAECEISQRFERDETQHEQLRPCQSGGNPAEGNDANGNEVCSAQSNADEFVPSKTCHDNFEQVKTGGTTFTSEIEIAGSVKLAAYKMVEAEFSKSTSKGSLIGAEDRTIWEFKEDEKQNSVNSLQPLQHDENISKVYGERNQQLKQIRSRKDQEASEEKPRWEGTGMKCEAGKGGLVFDETEEGKCLIGHTWGSREMQEVSRGDNDTFRRFPNSKCDPSPMAVAETRWVHTQDNMKAVKKDISRQISSQEVAEEIDTLRELQRQPQTVKRTEGDKSHKGNNEKPSVRELKIEVLGDLTGDTGFPRGESESVLTQFKEQEQPAGVKSSPRVESGKLSAGTKDPIMAGSAVALEVTEPTLDKTYVQRFGEDLVRAIWEEVFNLKVWGTHQDLKAVDEMAGALAVAPDVPPSEDFDDTFDSGVYSLMELAPESSLKPASVGQSDNWLPKEWSQALDPRAQTRLHRKSEMNLHSSAQFDVVIGPISPVNGGQSSSRLAQGPLSDLETHAQIRERSVACQETGRQTQESVAKHEEPRNQCNRTSWATPMSSSGKVKEPGDLMWWSVFYISSHITRLIICSLLVAGLCFVLFLCDSTAFFALYMFSLGWCFYKLKGHQVTQQRVWTDRECY